MPDKKQTLASSLAPTDDFDLHLKKVRAEMPASYKVAVSKLTEARCNPRKKRLKLAKEAIAMCDYLFPAYRLAALTELDDPIHPQVDAAIAVLEEGLKVADKLLNDGQDHPFEIAGEKCALLRLAGILSFHSERNEVALKAYQELASQKLVPAMEKYVVWELGSVLGDMGKTSELEELIAKSKYPSQFFFPYSRMLCLYRNEGFSDKFKQMLADQIRADNDTSLICLGLLFKQVNDMEEVLGSESTVYVAMAARKWIDICHEPEVYSFIVETLTAERADLLEQINDVRNQAKVAEFLSV